MTRNQAERDLPDFLDMVTSCVESGLGMDAAIQETCQRLRSPLTREFENAMKQIANGASRRDAMMSLAARLNIRELITFTGHVAQNETGNISVGNQLRALSADCRHRLSATAREKAGRLPTQLVFINVLFIPALILELLGFLSAWKLLAPALFIVAALIFPPILMESPKVKRRRSMEKQLADLLLSLASALRAGFSFVQAIDNVAKSTPPPFGDDLRLLAEELKRGESPEPALDRFADRTDSRETRLLAAAVSLQLRIGSNLAEILTNLSQDVRERVRLREEIATATSSVRFTGLILTALPLVLGAFITAVRLASFVISPLRIFDSVFGDLIGPTAGVILVGIAFGLQWLALMVIRRGIGQVEAQLS